MMRVSRPFPGSATKNFKILTHSDTCEVVSALFLLHLNHRPNFAKPMAEVAPARRKPFQKENKTSDFRRVGAFRADVQLSSTHEP